MKTKILAALKTEYKTSGLSEKAFDGVASVLAKTVTNEDEIEGVIKADETKSLIRAFQTDTDRVRTEKAQLQAEFEKYKTEHPAEKQEDKNKEDEPESETAKLLKRIEALEQEKKERDLKTTRDAIISAVRKKMKDSGSDNENILDLVLEKTEVKDGDKADDIAEKLKSEYDTTFTKFYGDGPAPRYHQGKTPEYKGNEDDDFVAKLRSNGMLPPKQG